MLLIDPEQGQFAYTQKRPPDLDAWFSREITDEDALAALPEPKTGTLLVQMWAPVDYQTSPFGWATEAEMSAAVMAWVLDDQGRDVELGLGADDFEISESAVEEIFKDPQSGEVDWIGDDDLDICISSEAEAGIVLIDRFPASVPQAIRDAVEARQEQRLAAVKGVVGEMDEAISEKAHLWIVRFGGSEVVGTPTSYSEQGTEIVLDHPFPRPEGKKNQQLRVPIRDVAVARKFTGKWRAKEGLGSPTFRHFRENIENGALTAPQLWNAVCRSCRMAVRLAWVSGACRSCAEGEVRTPLSVLSDGRLEGLLKARAEWLDLTVDLAEADGRWLAAYRSPGGSLVESKWVGEPMLSEAETKREVLIGLNQLSEDYGFTINPELEGRAEWIEVESTDL